MLYLGVPQLRKKEGRGPASILFVRFIVFIIDSRNDEFTCLRPITHHAFCQIFLFLYVMVFANKMKINLKFKIWFCSVLQGKKHNT